VDIARFCKLSIICLGTIYGFSVTWLLGTYSLQNMIFFSPYMRVCWRRYLYWDSGQTCRFGMNLNVMMTYFLHNFQVIENEDLCTTRNLWRMKKTKWLWEEDWQWVPLRKLVFIDYPWCLVMMMKFKVICSQHRHLIWYFGLCWNLRLVIEL